MKVGVGLSKNISLKCFAHWEISTASRLAVEVFEGTISVTYIRTRKMAHHTPGELGECVHLFQGISVQPNLP